MTSFPLFEKNSDKRIGPVVCYNDVVWIAAHLVRIGFNDNSPRVMMIIAIDHFIRKTFLPSSLDQYNQFTTTYENLLAEAELVKMKKLYKYAMNCWKNMKLKLRKVKKIVKKLSELIDRRYKERIMGYSVHVDPLTFRYKYIPVITWQHEDHFFLNRMMRTYVYCPSKMFNGKGNINTKKIMTLVPKINKRFLCRPMGQRWEPMGRLNPGHMDKALRSLSVEWTPTDYNDSDSE